MMKPSLQTESEKLLASWMQHDSEKLRDYLVSSVEDPRLNLQSIFSRHFLAQEILKLQILKPETRATHQEQFQAIIEQEYRFSAVMNWLKNLEQRLGDEAEIEALLYSLKRGADNAEGLTIPHFVLETFGSLPANISTLRAPNYIEGFLSSLKFEGAVVSDERWLDTFRDLWLEALGPLEIARVAAMPDQREAQPRLSVLEPACGSANDYRFLDAFGLARFLDYSGFDLCPKNIENARELFPKVRFEVGNVFEIAAPDKSFDLCFLHDLFEHLSLEGLKTAVREICRVTRRGICLGFFNMDEIPEHVERPMDDYYWNTLSMGRMKALFAGHGFAAQVVHIPSFLRQRIRCNQSHNTNAYTLLLRAAEESG